MAKVNLIHQALKYTVASEVDEFWSESSRSISPSDKTVQTDDLRCIVIYLVWQLKDSKILTEFQLIDEFLPESAKSSPKCLLYQMLSESASYLLESQHENIPEEVV